MGAPWGPGKLGYRIFAEWVQGRRVYLTCHFGLNKLVNKHAFMHPVLAWLSGEWGWLSRGYWFVRNTWSTLRTQVTLRLTCSAKSTQTHICVHTHMQTHTLLCFRLFREGGLNGRHHKSERCCKWSALVARVCILVSKPNSNLWLWPLKAARPWAIKKSCWTLISSSSRWG